MKITVEVDEGATPSAADVGVAVPEATAADGGAAPEALRGAPGEAAGTSDDAFNAGAPPLWLVEAVNQAAAQNGLNPIDTGEAADAGPGPASEGSVP